MKRFVCFSLSYALTVIGSMFVLAECPPLRTDPTEAARRAEIIKPTPEELRWQLIPWVTDLTEALQTAKTERRPIFLWVTGDDPLERC